MEIFIYTIIILLIVLAIYFRSTKIVIEIVGNIVVLTEENLKTANGQEKLNYAINKIRDKLPSYLSIFITRNNLIKIIEFILKIVKKGFNLENEIKLNYNVDKIGVELEKIKDNKDFTIYGKVKADTDFKGKNNASVEIGFQKKF